MDVGEQRVGVRTVIRAHRSPLREPLEDLHPLVASTFRALHELRKRELRHPQLKRLLECVLPSRRWAVAKRLQ